MALVEIYSRIIPDTRHWEVTVQDENGVVVDGADTGRIYSAVVAEGQPWAVMEQKLADEVVNGRNRKDADDDISTQIDMVSLNTLVDAR